VSLTAEHGLYVEHDQDEPDLVIEFSVCRQLGYTGCGSGLEQWMRSSRNRQMRQAVWARARGAEVAFDEESVRALLEQASPSPRAPK
jgi:hypothetical protein